MTKSENGKRFALIAAIFYAIHGLAYIINRIIFIQHSYNSITVSNIFLGVALIGMSVALFIKNEKIVLATAGVMVLLDIYYIIDLSNIDYLGTDWFHGIGEWLDGVSYVVLMIVLVLALRGNKVVNKIWFISPVVMLLSCLFYRSYGFVSIFEVVAVLFAGLWIKTKVTPAQDASVNENVTFHSQSVHSDSTPSSLIGGADKLKMYKDLLESGVITQEEFDAKKKQVLDL